MNQRIVFLIFAILALIGAPHPVSASSIVEFNNVNSTQKPSRSSIEVKGEINALRLRCTISDNKIRASYATVLKLETKSNTQQKIDVAITTGHGLLGEDGKLLAACFVSFPGGKPYPVTAAKLAPNYKSGSPSDWAVLIIPKIENDNLLRYAVGNKLTQKSFADMAEKRPSVLFASARGLPVNGQNCTLEPRRFAGLRHKTYIGLFSHTCRAIPGQSGAPISVVQNQQPIIIGIHIGNSMIYGYPTLNTPLHYRSYMRGIDEEFMVEFSKILAELNLQLQKKRKR